MAKPSRSIVHGLVAKKAKQDQSEKSQLLSESITSSPSQNQLFRLPSIDRLIKSENLKDTIGIYGLSYTTKRCQEVIAEIRAHVYQPKDKTVDTNTSLIPAESELISLIQKRCAEKKLLQFKSVINMTGTVIHTNLGRSVISEDAVFALINAARNPLNLEYDLEAGERGDRDYFVEELICEITGAQAATFVNNNAAAVLLTISALANNKEVIISRGEQVEIGGSFRMPDVMLSAGAQMVEVGTTNRTHLKDYEKAINERTALLMKIHTSNYQIQGFTKSVTEAELATLATAKGIPLATDLGSGSLIDMELYGLPYEPTPQEMLKAGCHVVTFSGDKLLGGPQAGIIVGSKREIDLIRKFPMKRALRLSKLPIVALEATLKMYLQPETLVENLPTLRWLCRSENDIAMTAKNLLAYFSKALAPHYTVQAAPMMSQIGSGSLPIDTLASYGLEITPNITGTKGLGSSLNKLADALRELPTPIICRVGKNKLLLDCRCVDDYQLVCNQIAKIHLD
jgi:L-seryl-tRNA(Ser) seleniumtransferase